MPKAVIVVPCYNEERRLAWEGFQPLVNAADVHILFVNDGSSDGTAAVLDKFSGTSEGRAAVLHLPANSGKAEAVRRGMRQAIAAGAAITGYLDADLATPAEQMLRLLRLLDDDAIEVALAARVRLLGTDIQRRALRHYLGRIFATLASLCLHIPVYDTQCGAKLFRCGPVLERALAKPFVARWAFDVELIGRLLRGSKTAPGLPLASFVEMPVERWRDVRGSKMRWLDFPRMGWELSRIWLRHGG